MYRIALFKFKLSHAISCMKENKKKIFCNTWLLISFIPSLRDDCSQWVIWSWARIISCIPKEDYINEWGKKKIVLLWREVWFVRQPFTEYSSSDSTIGHFTPNPFNTRLLNITFLAADLPRYKSFWIDRPRQIV